MRSIDLLLEEHRLIEAMADLLECAVERLGRGEPVPPARLAEIVDFFETFGDAGHHTREELELFPALLARGIAADSAPIQALTAQHEASRAYHLEMREALDRWETATVARAAFAASARDYLAMLREHIRIEDHYFTEFGALLTPEEDEVLAARLVLHAGANPIGRWRHFLQAPVLP
jgi:hemerythrin-like domain-containing protein